MFRNFEKPCSPREVWPPDWNLSFVLRCLCWPPFEPLRLASDKHLTCETSHLLALVSVKGLVSCTASLFRVHFLVVGGPAPFNSAVPDPHFDEFTVSSLDDFVDSDKAELFLCPIRALKKHLYPISTLPEHLHSTILRTPKLP